MLSLPGASLFFQNVVFFVSSKEITWFKDSKMLLTYSCHDYGHKTFLLRFFVYCSRSLQWFVKLWIGGKFSGVSLSRITAFGKF